MADEGIVYVLSNEAMPGLIKIGLTKSKMRYLVNTKFLQV